MAHTSNKTASGGKGLDKGLDKGLGTRLAWSGGLLAIGLTSAVAGAQLGVVHVNAGEMKIVMGRSESGFTMNIAGRNCPPDCGFDINWRPLAALTSTGG